MAQIIIFIGSKWIISQRYVLTLMGFLALFNAFAMRANLTIAITKMTYAVNNTDETALPKESICPMPTMENFTESEEGAIHWQSEIFAVNFNILRRGFSIYKIMCFY